MNLIVHSARPYPVRLERGLLGRPDELAASLPSAKVVLIVHTPATAELTAWLLTGLREQRQGSRAAAVVVPGGESAKTLAHTERIHVALSGLGATRTDLLIAVGGGTTTDVAGFAAATWRRGMPWVAVPTTLAGMVDAAIGGKTGVNTAAGKNTAGVAHDPHAVLIDLDTLSTLPGPALADGLAEAVKVSLSHDLGLLDLIGALDVHAPDQQALNTIVHTTVEVAVDVANGRYGPGGNADVLSYGHEIAHAVEHVSNLRVSHGAAVSLGLVYSARLAVKAGWLPAATLGALVEALNALSLPVHPAQVGLAEQWPQVRQALAHDKRMAGQLRFLSPSPEGVRWLGPVSEQQAQDTWIVHA